MEVAEAEPRAHPGFDRGQSGRHARLNETQQSAPEGLNPLGARLSRDGQGEQKGSFCDAASRAAVEETGATTDPEFGALPSVGGWEGSEEVACWPRSVPSVEEDRGATGTANTEAARESLAHVLAGRT